MQKSSSLQRSLNTLNTQKEAVGFSVSMRLILRTASQYDDTPL